jgi:hypothetical protein
MATTAVRAEEAKQRQIAFYLQIKGTRVSDPMNDDLVDPTIQLLYISCEFGYSLYIYFHQILRAINRASQKAIS